MKKFLLISIFFVFSSTVFAVDIQKTPQSGMRQPPKVINMTPPAFGPPTRAEVNEMVARANGTHVEKAGAQKHWWNNVVEFIRSWF